MGMQMGRVRRRQEGVWPASSIEKPLERQQDPGDSREVMEGEAVQG